MTYRLDDTAAMDTAILDAGPVAFAACVRAGMLSAQLGHGGEFSRAVALSLAKKPVWDKAVAAGLCVALPGGAYQLVGVMWRFNPTREEAAAIRVKRSLAGHLGGRPPKATRKQSAWQSESIEQSKPKAEAEAKGLLGLGSGSGSGSDAPAREEPRSTAPPESHVTQRNNTEQQRSPQPLGADNPGVQELAAAIRAERKFSSVDPVDMAIRSMPLGRLRPVAWLIRAVEEAAADTPPGEQPHLTHKRLRTYLWYAKEPRDPGPTTPQERRAPAYREDDDPEVIARIRRGPKRLTAQDQAMLDKSMNASAAALLAGIGNGGK